MQHKRSALTFAAITVATIAAASPAFASSGGSLPWEGPLEQIQESITGPVAGYIALAAVAIAGGMLIFGGELNDFARRLMYVVLVAGHSAGCDDDRRSLWRHRRVYRPANGSSRASRSGRSGGGGVLSLHRNRIHRALSRPNLLMGADRELVLITGLAAVILIFVVLTIYSALFGVAVWIVIVGLLRMLAKSDPLMRRVYARHISYKPHYRPTAAPWRRY